jgi:hypothetical protein
MYLLLIRSSHHVTRHVPNAFVNDLRHGRHNPFRLRAIQSFALQALDEMVGVKMKVLNAR